MSRLAGILVALALSIIAAWLTLGFIAGMFALFGWMVGKHFAEASLVDYVIYQYMTTKQYFFLGPPLVVSVYTFLACLSLSNRTDFLEIVRKPSEKRFYRILAVFAIFWFFAWSIFCYFRLSQNHLFLPCEFSCGVSWEMSEWIMYSGVLIGLPYVLVASCKLVNWIGEGK